MPQPLSFEELLTQSPCGQLADLLLKRNWRLATAESCTGGLVACLCTALAGSSQWMERGFVTYSNASKTEMLGVLPGLIASQGAVSAEVAQAMAAGALHHSEAQVALAITGVAGPGGGSAEKPVGCVWFAWQTPEGQHSEMQQFAGDRSAIRFASALHSLRTLVHLLQGTVPSTSTG